MTRSYVARMFLRLLVTGILLSGCGGDSGARTNISEDDRTNGGATGITVPGPTLTNTPQATFWVTKSEETADLELLSSNLVPKPDSTLNFIEWFGEVRNNGTTPACYVELTLDFRAASGARVEALRQFARGALYQTAKTKTPISCIPPGKTGAFYANDLPAVPVALSSIARIDARLTLSTAYPDAAPYPSNPSLSGVAFIRDPTNGSGQWSFAGTLTAAASIKYIEISVFYKDAAGLIFQKSEVLVDAVAAGQSREFKTLSVYGAEPSTYLFYVNYLLGE